MQTINAEIIKRGVLNHLATFSADSNIGNPMLYDTIGSVQSGGGLDNNINNQVDELIKYIGDVTDIDKNSLVGIAEKINGNKIASSELLNYIKKLKNIKSILGAKIDAEKLMENTKEIDYIDDEIQKHSECLDITMQQTNILCKNLMQKYTELNGKVKKN